MVGFECVKCDESNSNGDIIITMTFYTELQENAERDPRTVEIPLIIKTCCEQTTVTEFPDNLLDDAGEGVIINEYIQSIVVEPTASLIVNLVHLNLNLNQNLIVVV